MGERWGGLKGTALNLCRGKFLRNDKFEDVRLITIKRGKSMNRGRKIIRGNLHTKFRGDYFSLMPAHCGAFIMLRYCLQTNILRGHEGNTALVTFCCNGVSAWRYKIGR